MKLQEELKDTGFAIVAAHSQNGTKEEIVNLLRKNRVNYTVTSGGDVPGEQVKGIPAAFLFDSSGKLVQKGNPSSMHKTIRDLTAAAPHFLAAGKKFTKLAPVAEALKKTKAYGPILKRLEKDMKGEGAAAEEAKFLHERILGHGKKKLDEAKALEADDPLLAQETYVEVANCWKGAEPGDQAAARLKELKADKDFQDGLKAGAILRDILAQCEKLVVSGGTINLDLSSNRKIAANVRAQAAALKKKHPKSRAAERVAKELEPFGFKDV